MEGLKKIETAVLLVMVAAYCSDYGRTVTADEANDCKTTIDELYKEIATRKDAPAVPFIRLCHPVIFM